MADLAALLSQVPPEQVFSYIKTLIEEEIFPVLGSWFWPIDYVCIVLACVIIITLTVAMVIQAKRGRLHWITRDGNASRPAYIPWVSSLYTVDAVSFITFSFILRRDLLEFEWTGSAGRFWFLCHLPLVLSWSFVLVHTLASSPPIRRFLSRRSQRSAAIILNSPIVILSAGLTAAIFVPAMQQGQVMIDSQKNYLASIAIIEAAKAQANPLMLAALAPNLQTFDECNSRLLSAVRTGGIIFTINQVITLCIVIVPAYALSTVVRKRIARYEGHTTSSLGTGSSTSASGVPTIHIPHLDIPLTPQGATAEMPSDSFVPEENNTQYGQTSTSRRVVNKDAPFANIVPVKTTTFPSAFQDVIDQKHLEHQEKAARLRHLLRQEQLQLLSYGLLVCGFAAYTIFMAADGERPFTTRQQIYLNTLYPAIAFVLPASVHAVISLRTALLPDVVKPAPARGRGLMDGLSSGIALTQVLSISEDINSDPTYEEEEKKRRF